MPDRTGLAPWRLGVASCGRSLVARRLRSAWTRGENRRLGCHGLCRLVVRHSRRAAGVGRPTHDQHTTPTPSIRLILADLVSWSAVRCETTRPTFPLHGCTEDPDPIRHSRKTTCKAERTAIHPTQLTRVLLHGAGFQETQSNNGCDAYKRTEVACTVGVARDSCAVVDRSGFVGS